MSAGDPEIPDPGSGGLTHVPHHDVPAGHADLAAVGFVHLVDLVVVDAFDGGPEARKRFADRPHLLLLVGVGQLRPGALAHAWSHVIKDSRWKVRKRWTFEPFFLTVDLEDAHVQAHEVVEGVLAHGGGGGVDAVALVQAQGLLHLLEGQLVRDPVAQGIGRIALPLQNSISSH